MNANFQPKTLAIKTWLDSAEQQLAEIGIDSARLDVELILSHTIRKPRAYLHAHPDEELSDRQVTIANARLELRLDRTPVAYITGHKQFYGRSFKVTTATLIPRPESEDLIEAVKEIANKNPDLKNLVDVGTGSGCLGITLKLELPNLNVTLLDISRPALNVSKDNANTWQVDVKTVESNLLQNYPLKPDIIVANLPYVDEAWERSPETNHEPKLALFAQDNGRELVFKLIEQAKDRLATKGGYLVLEADPYQHPSIKKHAANNSLKFKKANHYCLVFQKA